MWFGVKGNDSGSLDNIPQVIEKLHGLESTLKKLSIVSKENL